MKASNDRDIVVIACASWVRGLRRETGEVCWEVDLVASNWNRQQATEIIVRDDIVLAAPYGSEMLSCLDYRTGRLIGQVQVGDVGRKTILLDEDRIFVSVWGQTRCFDLRGNLLWEYTPPGLRGHTAIGVPGNVRQADED